MVMIDLAREQCPNREHLVQYATTALEGGFDSLGLYLEHRFAYPSLPWAAGTGALRPADVDFLQREFPSLKIVPFINLLGHFEGMMYTEEGRGFREAKFSGLQACPSNREFNQICDQILEDTLTIFSSDLIHIGGDETAQLGHCDTCKQKVDDWEKAGEPDGKAKLYGEHFARLADKVTNAGRRPAIWADMLANHPSAMAYLPKETLLFDWQYFSGCAESAAPLVEHGFEVVGCPALHTYNAVWMHIEGSETNIRDVASDVNKLNLAGSCLTTWECGLFGAYDSLFPAIKAAGNIIANPDSGSLLEGYQADCDDAQEWANLMGVELEKLGGVFGFSKIRSSIKARFLLQANPFLLWLHNGEELAGEKGMRALQIIEHGLRIAPNEAMKGICRFARGAIEFSHLCSRAQIAYAQRRPEEAISVLASTRIIFDDLERVAKATHARIGGSLADQQRCILAKKHVESALQKIRHYGDGSMGYLPAFEHITHPKFVPHDQAAWWLINKWAND